MFKLLIVDNEKVIVNSLKEYFVELDRLDLEVYGAYSAAHALGLLEEIKFDVVLSDIRMPRMSGLEMQEEIRRRWPRCRILFLSGYDDFPYIQQAVRNGAANYILKTEGYPVIEEAVLGQLREVQEEDERNRLMKEAEHSLRSSLPLLKKELVLGLIHEDRFLLRDLEQQFEQCRMNLSVGSGALMILGRVDEWRNITQPSDKALLLFAVQNIAEELWAPSVRCYSCAVDGSRILWLVQPDRREAAAGQEALERSSYQFVKQHLSDLQQMCLGMLGIGLSFALGSAFKPWTQMGEQFEALRMLLNIGLGAGKETILLESFSPVCKPSAPQTPLQTVHHDIILLQNHLEHGDQTAFYLLLNRILSRTGSESATQRLETVSHLSAMMLSLINRWNLEGDIARSADIALFSRLDAVKDWKGCISAFHQISESLFAVRTNRQENQENTIIQRIQHYVTTHLAEDLSLTRLGDIFGHHPYYLSRLYKQITTVSLSEFISEARLAKAAKLLAESDMRIHQIPEEVGFISESYFYRLFKKTMNATPQEYREAAQRKLYS